MKQNEVNQQVADVLQEIERLLENMRKYHTQQFPKIYELQDKIKALLKINGPGPGKEVKT